MRLFLKLLLFLGVPVVAGYFAYDYYTTDTLLYVSDTPHTAWATEPGRRAQATDRVVVHTTQVRLQQGDALTTDADAPTTLALTVAPAATQLAQSVTCDGASGDNLPLTVGPGGVLQFARMGSGDTCTIRTTLAGMADPALTLTGDLGPDATVRDVAALPPTGGWSGLYEFLRTHFPLRSLLVLGGLVYFLLTSFVLHQIALIRKGWQIYRLKGKLAKTEKNAAKELNRVSTEAEAEINHLKAESDDLTSVIKTEANARLTTQHHAATEALGQARAFVRFIEDLVENEDDQTEFDPAALAKLRAEITILNDHLAATAAEAESVTTL